MTGNDPGSTLSEELSTSEDLLATLRQEQACLCTGDAGQIAVLLSVKAVQVARLSRLAADRHQQLATEGFATSQAGMQAWLASASETAQAQWHALMDIVRQANEVNRVNGMLLAQQLVKNRQHLQAMGMTGPGHTLYGPDGQVGQDTVRRASVQG